MRLSMIVLATLLASTLMLGQRKVVITSGGRVIPLQNGESSFDVAQRYGIIRRTTASCGNTTVFGYTNKAYPCNLPFVGYHHDVWGQWFLTPSSGSIDSIYIDANDQNEMTTGTAKIRIFNSNIFPGSGPGYGPYHVPRHSWGYYFKSNLTDEPGGSGITPFKDYATDTTWIPTNIPSDSLIPSGTPDSVASFDPLGDEIWGSGGWPHVFTINTVNGIGMLELGYEPAVVKNQAIFITVEQLGQHGTSGNAAQDNITNPATWCASNQGIPSPPVNWKFYEHSTAGNRGWHARAEASWMWWMVMTVTGDTPPDILSLDRLSHTLSMSTRTVNAEIQDCNPGHPDSAGVASVTMTYSINGAPEVTEAMPNSSADFYSATIPGAGPESHIYYYVTATDIKGNVTVSPKIAYSIVDLHNPYYTVDTAATYNWIELSGNGGTQVPSSAYFNTRGTQGPPTDDGTAGPINMGDAFWMFGDTARYAWLGANGGMAITKTSTETQQICGQGGSFSGNWLFPSSVVPNVDMPHNFIAPLSNDFSLAPSSPDEPFAHGAIWYKHDSTRFIVEWDSVGVVSKLIPDTTYSFEVILDNSDRSVTFQFKHIDGPLRLDTSALIGMQSDSLTRWILLNTFNNPPELRPRNGQAWRLSLQALHAIADGWNLLSIPGGSPDYHKSYVFSGAVSSAFAYRNGYVVEDLLENGVGYWLKYSGNQSIGIPASPRASVVDTVSTGWNMIGSLTSSVATSTIVQSTTGMVTSQYFYYGGGYHTSTSIDPGFGYWVKTNTGGTLTLNSAAASPKQGVEGDPLASLNTITVRDNAGRSQTLYFGRSSTIDAASYELPPQAPEGAMDVRFASQRMVELIPSDLSSGASFPLQITSATYPVSVTWDIRNSAGAAYGLSFVDGKNHSVSRAMGGGGRMVLQSPVSAFTVSAVSGSADIPKVFALDQNYPNPFNPTTSIRYALPADAHVSLKIYNVAGQEVAQLVDAIEQAGYHTISWNSRNLEGNDVGSGVYLIRIIASDVSNPNRSFDQVRKMILLK